MYGTIPSMGAVMEEKMFQNAGHSLGRPSIAMQSHRSSVVLSTSPYHPDRRQSMLRASNPIPMDVNLAPAGANAQVCANTATTPVQLVDHETPDDFPSERTTVVTAAASTPTRPRCHSLESDGVPSPSASAFAYSGNVAVRTPSCELHHTLL
jgi:hypothetical protein